MGNSHGSGGERWQAGAVGIPKAEALVGLPPPPVGKLLSKGRRPIALPRFSERLTTQERPQHISSVQSMVSGVRGTWVQMPIPAFPSCIRQ